MTGGGGRMRERMATQGACMGSMPARADAWILSLGLSPCLSGVTWSEQFVPAIVPGADLRRDGALMRWGAPQGHQGACRGLSPPSHRMLDPTL